MTTVTTNRGQLLNVTFDDFDQYVSYTNEKSWDTPDPSQNLTENQVWKRGTYHKTNIVNNSVAFHFQGPSIKLYGASGPSYGSYAVNIDKNSEAFSAYAPQNASVPFLLYSNDKLSYGPHVLVLTNLGAKDGDNGANELLFDYATASFLVAPVGASLHYKKLEENNSALTYTGEWTRNVYAPDFSGGYSMFTKEENATVSFKFNGTALYVYGDIVNDHGEYTVQLDKGEPEQFNAFAGCRGVGRCEAHGTLAYFKSNLNGSEHSVTITNNGSPNAPFFDLDVIEYITPTIYNVDINDTATSSTQVPSGNGPTSTAVPRPGGAATSLETFTPTFLLVYLFCFMFAMKASKSIL